MLKGMMASIQVLLTFVLFATVAGAQELPSL